VSGDFLRWNIQESGDYFGGFGTGQLWFILWLFGISLVALPLVLWGTRGGGLTRMQAVSRRLAKPAWWPLAVLLLFLGEAAPEFAGKNFVYYLFIFLLGYLAFQDPAFGRSAERYRLPALAVGVALCLFWALTPDLRGSVPDPSFARAGLTLAGMAGTWLMLVGLLGYGRRLLDRDSASRRYLAEASYPVYILHQTFIVILAFSVVAVAMPAPLTALVILVGAVACTFAAYEIVRRVRALRFILGMRPRARPRPAVQPVALPASVEDPTA
jgi:peptidoglycan/LPS O-acetylase OafA/YrhL